MWNRGTAVLPLRREAALVLKPLRSRGCRAPISESKTRPPGRGNLRYTEVRELDGFPSRIDSDEYRDNKEASSPSVYPICCPPGPPRLAAPPALPNVQFSW